LREVVPWGPRCWSSRSTVPPSTSRCSAARGQAFRRQPRLSKLSARERLPGCDAAASLAGQEGWTDPVPSGTLAQCPPCTRVRAAGSRYGGGVRMLWRGPISHSRLRRWTPVPARWRWCRPGAGGRGSSWYLVPASTPRRPCRGCGRCRRAGRPRWWICPASPGSATRTGPGGAGWPGTAGYWTRS
jgi:hypothetical protein